MMALVTGAAGFLGSHLTDALLERGDAVIGLDDLSAGSLSNLCEAGIHPRFRFVEGDVRDRDLVSRLITDCDCVIHLAANKIPRYNHAIDTLSVNVDGTRVVLTAAADRRCRVLFASTSDVYGCNPRLPFSENHELLIGSSTVRRWSYALSKLYGEGLGLSLVQGRELPFTALRLFGAYGPRQNPTWRGGPQAVFMAAALRGEPMELHGDGQQTRTFTYISDHVTGCLLALDSQAAIGETFNIGSPEEISIQSLAEQVWRMAGQGEPRFRMIPYATFGKYEDVRRRVPDIAKARELLGYTPRVSLESGLADTVAWILRAEGGLLR